MALSNPPNYSERIFLQERTPYLRRLLIALGENGRSRDYYLTVLDNIMKETRYISTKLTLPDYEQERLDI